MEDWKRTDRKWEHQADIAIRHLFRRDIDFGWWRGWRRRGGFVVLGVSQCLYPRCPDPHFRQLFVDAICGATGTGVERS